MINAHTSQNTSKNTTSTKLAYASILELNELLKNKEISPQELLQETLKRSQTHDKNLKSLLEIFDEESLKRDYKDLCKNSNNIYESPLFGIPGVFKDVICQRERITSCASRMLEHFIAPYDATVVERLKKLGAYSIGRANCDELAMGSTNETSAFAKTANPWDITRVPGGSSGGSAAAVAAGLVPWALGSETGGSVRQPASWCGIVGLKPTYGLVSRYGLVAYASSLDQISPLTRTVYDNALILSAIAGQDSKDSTSRPVQACDYTKNLTGALKPNLKIGIIDNALHAHGIDPSVKTKLEEALEQFKKLGAKITTVHIPLLDYAAAMYFIVSRAEAASNLARFDGVRYGHRATSVDSLTDLYERSRSEGFGRIVKQRILIGNYVLSAGYADAYYASAKKAQSLLRAEFLKAFESVDVLFSPVSPTTAPKFGAFDKDTFALDLQDYFTAGVNLAHIPAIALPCGFTEQKLPVGFQLIGPDLSEEMLYQTAYAYEQSTPWHTMHPQEFYTIS